MIGAAICLGSVLGAVFALGIFFAGFGLLAAVSCYFLIGCLFSLAILCRSYFSHPHQAGLDREKEIAAEMAAIDENGSCSKPV